MKRSSWVAMAATGLLAGLAGGLLADWITNGSRTADVAAWVAALATVSLVLAAGLAYGAARDAARATVGQLDILRRQERQRQARQVTMTTGIQTMDVVAKLFNASTEAIYEVRVATRAANGELIQWWPPWAKSPWSLDPGETCTEQVGRTDGDPSPQGADLLFRDSANVWWYRDASGLLTERDPGWVELLDEEDEVFGRQQKAYQARRNTAAGGPPIG